MQLSLEHGMHVDFSQKLKNNIGIIKNFKRGIQSKSAEGIVSWRNVVVNFFKVDC